MATREGLKHKAARVGEELREGGRLVLRSSALVRTAECAIRFLLGAVLSGAEIFGGYAPFGLAMVGASGSGMGGFSALLGACLGYLSFQGFAGGLRYAAAAILIFAVAFAFYDVRVYRWAWFMPVVTAVMDAVTASVYLGQEGWQAAGVICFATELLLSGGCTHFYRVALSPWTERREEATLSKRQLASLLILGGTALMALAKVELYGGISVGRLCAVLAVMCLAYRGGAGMGAAVGVAAGLGMDLAAGGAPFYSMAYAFAGLLEGIFSRQGKLFAALAYILANGVSLLWTWGEETPLAILYEVFIASVLFMLLPGRFFRWLGALTADEAPSDTRSRAFSYLHHRLDAAAAAFRGLQETLRGSFAAPVNDNDSAAVFDRAAERVCRSCALRSACWQRDYVSTYNALNDALPSMMARGRGVPGDFPSHFSGRCLKFPDFLAAANEELTALLYRREYRSRLRESRETVAGQYTGLAEVLGAAAAELGSELVPDPVREKRLRQHLAALGLEGETAVYYDQRGRLRAEIEGRDLAALEQPEEEKKLSHLLGMPLRQTVEETQRHWARIVLTQAEPLAALAGAAARKKDGETVSGDTGAWFRREDGVLFALLCDGMGSGPEAERESGLAVRLLEQFLQAGIAAQSALRTLAVGLGLRGEEQGGFTTVDLLEVDLFTGEAAVYKYGAAPTYLRKGDKVSRITGSALPAGLVSGEGGAPDVARFRLEAGDWVVLVSDGVTSSDEDAWLRERLAGAAEESPRELSRTILEGSDGRAGGEDDRTVLVIRLTGRS